MLEIISIIGSTLKITYLVKQPLWFTSLGDLATFIFYTFSIAIFMFTGLTNFLISYLTNKLYINSKDVFFLTITISIMDIISITVSYLVLDVIIESILSTTSNTLNITSDLRIYIISAIFLHIINEIYLNYHKNTITSNYRKRKNWIADQAIKLFIYTVLIWGVMFWSKKIQYWNLENNYSIYLSYISVIVTIFVISILCLGQESKKWAEKKDIVKEKKSNFKIIIYLKELIQNKKINEVFYELIYIFYRCLQLLSISSFIIYIKIMNQDDIKIIISMGVLAFTPYFIIFIILIMKYNASRYIVGAYHIFTQNPLNNNEQIEYLAQEITENNGFLSMHNCTKIVSGSISLTNNNFNFLKPEPIKKLIIINKDIVNKIEIDEIKSGG